MKDTLLEVIVLDKELKRKHAETLKKAWLLKMMRKAKVEWETKRKLSLTLAK